MKSAGLILRVLAPVAVAFPLAGYAQAMGPQIDRVFANPETRELIISGARLKVAGQGAPAVRVGNALVPLLSHTPTLVTGRLPALLAEGDYRLDLTNQGGSAIYLLTVAYPSSGGTQGPQGPAGPQGVAGNVGAQGPQGAAGPAGPQGQTGPQGLQGPAGTPGLGGLQVVTTVPNVFVDPRTSITGTHQAVVRINCPAGSKAITGTAVATFNGVEVDPGIVTASTLAGENSEVSWVDVTLQHKYPGGSSLVYLTRQVVCATFP